MNVGFDLRYAWRLLRKSWGYSLMCASVVALSVGLAIWAWAMAYAQLMKPIGLPSSERWYSIQIAQGPGVSPESDVDAYTYQELLKQNRSAEHVGAYAWERTVLSEGQASTSLRTGIVNPRLLAGVVPLKGRMFEEADARPGAAAVAILTFETWQNYFAGDPNVVGKITRIDAAPAQIIGVLQKDFWAFQDFELWLPLKMPNLARPGDSKLVLTPMIALGENQSLNAVENEMKAVVDRVNREYPELFKSTRYLKLIPGPRMFTYSATPIVGMILFMSAAVLLLGAVNIGMVFLARLLERSRELALRVALGASRPRILRQCLLETSLIVVVGLVGGYGFAVLGIHWFQWIAGTLASVLAIGRIEAFMVLRPVDALAAVVFGATIWLVSTVIPVWRIVKQDAAVVLAGSGKGTSNRGSNRSAALLVGLQVVISSLVVVVCGCMVLAVHKEVSKPSGFDTARIMVSTAPTIFGTRYSEETQRLRYWEDLAAAIRTKIPGTEVAFTTAAPSRPRQVPAAIEARQAAQNESALTLPLAVVSDNYFRLLGLRLRSGRFFDSTDDRGSLDVAIVDEELAARYWPDQDVIGKRVQLNPSENGPWLTIVGVVSSVTGGRPYRKEDVGVVYQPLIQAVPSQFQLLAKLPNATPSSRVALRAAAFAVDRDLPLNNLQMFEDYLAALKLPNKAIIPVISTIALITVLISATGLFGLISRSVAQRTQEVGIRRALGATPWRVISMFLRQGGVYLSMGIVGIVLGILVMPVMSREITNILDHAIAVTFGVVFLMAAVIFAASYLPSRRAVAMEPGEALRYE